jgi:hypothetical protein
MGVREGTLPFAPSGHGNEQPRGRRRAPAPHANGVSGAARPPLAHVNWGLRKPGKRDGPFSVYRPTGRAGKGGGGGDTRRRRGYRQWGDGDTVGAGCMCPHKSWKYNCAPY